MKTAARNPLKNRFILLFPIAFAAYSQTAEAPKPPALRLGESVRPTSYSLELSLTPAEDAYSGTVTVQLDVREPVSVFWMNASKLTVGEAALKSSGRSETAAKVLDGGTDFVGFQFPRTLRTGPATLRIRFQGKLETKSSDAMFRGIDSGEKYIYTQFEPIAARRAFPCFDEPAFKVPWQLTLEVPGEHRAYANTPQASETKLSNGRKRVAFARSKPMPSYLVAYAVGPFEEVDAGRAGKNKTAIRILTPKGRTAEAAYAKEVTPRILEALEAYFGSPYPFQKLDQIAVPLFGGAMENPGLVTYADSMILAKADQDTTNRRRGFFSVCGHELAHQWFGDLVTMAWWNDTWLNEAFATWMANKITGKLQPDWRTDVSAASSRLGIMNQDALTTARRIRQPVESNSDIANAFDGITYVKGGAVLSMLESWLGEDSFRDGVRLYMKRHAWGNARAEDFLAALGDGAKLEVSPTASTFIDQSGVPEVTVGLECGAGKPAVTLAQKRFIPLGSTAKPQTWQIPVCVAHADGRQCTLLKTAEARLELTGAKGCPAWILGNADMRGYYRVRYQGDLLTRLIENQFDQLPLPAKVGVLGDVGALTRTGAVSASDALSLVPKVAASEERQLVTAAASLATSVTGGATLSDSLRPNFTRFIHKMFAERARKLGWLHQPSDDEETRLLRASVVGLAANTGKDQALITEAETLAAKWLTDRKAIPPDMTNAVLQAATGAGGRALFNQFLAAAKLEKDPRQRQRLISSLGGFSEPDLVKEAQKIGLSDTFDARESMFLFFAGFGEPATRRMPFEFVRDNFDAVLKRIPNSLTGGGGAFLPQVAGGFCSAPERKEAEEVFTARMKEVMGGPRILAQVLESITLCEARRSAQQASVAQFLEKY